MAKQTKIVLEPKHWDFKDKVDAFLAKGYKLKKATMRSDNNSFMFMAILTRKITINED
jgi:hypothetical protein